MPALRANGRHSRAGGNPGAASADVPAWIPAFAGMTRKVECLEFPYAIALWVGALRGRDLAADRGVIEARMCGSVSLPVC
jgi:hypothetical protein